MYCENLPKNLPKIIFVKKVEIPIKIRRTLHIYNFDAIRKHTKYI